LPTVSFHLGRILLNVCVVARTITAQGEEGGMKARRKRKKISAAEQALRARQRAMSIAEFCQRYGVGRTTAYGEINSGRLRARKIGKRTVITDDDAEHWLEDLPTIAPAHKTEAA
jgi:excisionase family DNA binding protein